MKGKAFNEALFNAVIQGQMTQFCEIMKPQPTYQNYPQHKGKHELVFKDVDGECWLADKNNKEIKTRFQAGETVYLKEPYCTLSGTRKAHVLYKYDFYNKKLYQWKNKISMNKEYSRYFIEITGVKVERVQDIRDEDLLESGIFIDYIESHYYQYYDHIKRFWCEKCIDKGIEQLEKELRANPSLLQIGDSNEVDEDDKEHEEYIEEWFKEEFGGYSMDDFFDEAITCDICEKDLSVIKNISGNKKYYDITEAYAELIDEIHGKGKWESNPYVFRYEFELLK